VDYNFTPGKNWRRTAIPLSLSLCLLVLAAAPAPARATTLASAAPLRSATPLPGPGDGEIVGSASGALACLAVGATDGQAAGRVTLNWTGRAERARLILWVAGAEAAHTIRVNGQAVASAPVAPAGEACGGEVFYLDLPPSVLVRGENTVEITNDQQAGDAWTASRVRLEVFAPWQAPDPSTASLAATTATSITVSFTNSFDASSQQAWVQVPTGYNDGNPTPLVIYVHGRSSNMFEPADPGTDFDVAADARGWLLASPQLHGRWPGTVADPIPNPPGRYAYASVESQYDVLGTVKYMLDHYNVKHDQIYLVGNSMGGQIATVVAAKFPHVFAAVYDVKGPTDLAQWHSESDGFHRAWMERECYTGSAANPQRATPAQNPFCYQRRSSQWFDSNYLHVPISITHSLADELVPIAHSFELRDAINSFGPDRTAAVLVDTVIGPACGQPYHCYDPEWSSVLTFLAQFTLSNTPLHVNVFSDESKPYYWLSLTQSGGNHWSHVEATANPGLRTVALQITDPQPLTVRLNLGSTPITGDAGLSQPGLGFPAGQYRVQGLGLDNVVNYTSGYLNINVPATSQGGSVTVTPVGVTFYHAYLPFFDR
jgi:pimeloyl-ACP methyl ester carboxylesterase